MKKISAIVKAAMLLLVVGCTGIPDGLQPVTGFELERYTRAAND